MEYPLGSQDSRREKQWLVLQKAEGIEVAAFGVWQKEKGWRPARHKVMAQS